MPQQQLTLNEILFLFCSLVGGTILFAMMGRALAYLQNKLSKSCKPTRPEVENGHPIGEPKPFIDNYKK